MIGKLYRRIAKHWSRINGKRFDLASQTDWSTEADSILAQSRLEASRRREAAQREVDLAAALAASEEAITQRTEQTLKRKAVEFFGEFVKARATADLPYNGGASTFGGKLVGGERPGCVCIIGALGKAPNENENLFEQRAIVECRLYYSNVQAEISYSENSLSASAIALDNPKKGEMYFGIKFIDWIDYDGGEWSSNIYCSKRERIISFKCSTNEEAKREFLKLLTQERPLRIRT